MGRVKDMREWMRSDKSQARGGGGRGGRAEMKGVSPWEKSSSPENLSL